MLNLSKLQNKKQSYKRDAVNLLLNRLLKKLRMHFVEIKDFAAFQEVSF